MGGKWSVLARNKKDDAWKVSIYTNNTLVFVFQAVRCLIEYEVVSLGKHGR